MFSVADLIERAKARANIDTDYRLAKVIGINQSAIGNYRAGRSVPDARVLEQLCALSGDDLAVFVAQAQAERERTPEGRKVWLGIAARLQHGVILPAQSAILALLAAIVLVASSAGPAPFQALLSQAKAQLTNLYIVLSRLLGHAGPWSRLRRRRRAGGAAVAHA